MRSIVTIKKDQHGYRADASGKFGGGYSNAFAGKTAEEAATFAIANAIRYCTSEGCDLCAPQEIKELLPSFEGRDIAVF